MMPFKTILIDARRERRLPGQLIVAVDLAARFCSHLIGLAVLSRAIVLPAGERDASNIVNIEIHRTRYREEARRMRTAFDIACADHNVSGEWVLKVAERQRPAAAMDHHVQTADLIIASPIEAGSGHASAMRLVEHLVFETGRPVLLTPKAFAPLPVGRRVLVAWNGTSECAKAAFDALPFLQAAHHVKLFLVGEEKESADRQSNSAALLCETLARHDVRVNCESIALPGVDVGSALLSAVKAENADLLVMGCYGYPRQNGLDLGAASRHVMSDSPVPVLMSH